MAVGGKSVGSKSPRAGARKRVSAPSSGVRARQPTAGGAGSMFKFYSGDDSPGIQIGPVPVLVMSLLFIAVVFLLHIWGKYTRS
ncbi:PREDICTED: protein transport protein Sec61 subunit beta-like [Amphimedon queenslandica]|uniref:Protein transport protein Sec61 subunit beta n=1 Tax=Amphimedon queenslandica TaxID=400682 RepID=A0A1X7UIN5_AMPQE|nr:PREDICTED: protein transport protein Sec61 subunit beta-like [Amphimedon queenslandica]|eukprot:XP_003387704.1 PREDICTED: protein transport protein Sec61 subunit beta-like [Amphimedon queenslandica]